MNSFAAFLLMVSASFLVSSCRISSVDLEYSRAEEAVQRGEHEQALKHFEKIIEKDPRSPKAVISAKEAARITHYQLKRFKEAAVYYKNVILYADSQKDRIEAQKKLADLHFNQTLDYTQAIIEYSRLLELPHSSEEDLQYRMAIARAYFYKNNFYQAQVEIETIIKRGSDDNLLFDALLLKANVYLTTKQLDEAVQALKQIIAKYPERAKNETIGLVLAVTYEEQKNYAKAIETLELIRESYPRKAFIDHKVRTLKERQSYLPGAKGLKK